MSRWIRQTHRWVSIIFVATVILNIVVMSMAPGQQPPPLVVYSPLPPLFLLMLTGLYMFALPYAIRRRARG
jgi:hypothetical protein